MLKRSVRILQLSFWTLFLFYDGLNSSPAKKRKKVKMIIWMLFFIIHSHLYSFTEPFLLGEDEWTFIINNITVIQHNNNMSNYYNNDNTAMATKHKDVTSSCPWAENCWSLGEIFEEMSLHSCHPLGIHIRWTFGLNLIAWHVRLHCFYFIIITLQISGSGLGFYIAICCTHYE